MAKGRATTVWAAIRIPHACTVVALAEGLEHCLFSWVKQVLPSLALRREKSTHTHMLCPFDHKVNGRSMAG